MKLKPCPFCYGINLFIKREPDVNWLYVCCRDCGCEGPFKISEIPQVTENEAINIWNRRVEEKQP